MNNVINIQTPHKSPGAIIPVAGLQQQATLAVTKIIDTTDTISLAQDPIGFFETHTTATIYDELRFLSMTSTQGYIRAYLICLNYMSHFEEQIGNLFMACGNKKEKLIMSLIYLINYPKIDTHIYNTLITIVSNCTPGEALSAKKTMTQIGIIWTDDTHDDPIFAQFITKAQYAEHGLREVTSI